MLIENSSQQLLLHSQRPHFLSQAKFLIKKISLFVAGSSLKKSFKATCTMASAPDQSILDSLRGSAVETAKKPMPRLVKIYISSSKQGEKEN
jgi:hypothetical protein